MSEPLVIFAILFGAIFIGVPVPVAVIGATALGLLWLDIPLVVLAQTAYTGLESIPLMTIPLFVLAGALMERGGMSDRIIDIARALVGNYTGSLGLVTIVACMFFAALSGSGPATTAAVGTVTIPAMLREGYRGAFAGAITASGGALGSLIPPSTLMIIYGIVAEVSIPRLFLAGILPGVLVGALLLATNLVMARRYGLGRDQLATTRHPAFWPALWEGKWAVAAPVIVLGGIYAGIFTATEAAAVAVFYALGVGFLVYRGLTGRRLYDCLRMTALVTGTVILILGPAKAFGQIVTYYDIPALVAEMLGVAEGDPFVLLVVIGLMLIVLGTFIESIAQIILLTPILLPIVTAAGVDPILFGVIFVLACEIGFLTPPVGVNLFVASRLANAPIEALSLAVTPFLFAYALCILILAAYPGIALTLPGYVYG